MKSKFIIPLGLLLLLISAFIFQLDSENLYFNPKNWTSTQDFSYQKPECCKPKIDSISDTKKGCVYKTVFEHDFSDSDFIYKTSENVEKSIIKALEWISKEQLADGGWSAQTNVNSIKINPNSNSQTQLKSDPATTAMVSMALLRCGNTPFKGTYQNAMVKSTQFLIECIENSSSNDINITTIKGTQPQYKLGHNIDVMLTSQYLTNLLPVYNEHPDKKNQVKKCIEICVNKIQKAQNQNGSFVGSGWAGVLQSSFANNALETAKSAGIMVDSVVLEKSRMYQKNNFDADNNKAVTSDGAGIILYSVSSSGRASAKEANQAKKYVEKAKKSGLVKENETVTNETLEKAGLSKSEALKYSTAYKVNVNASKLAAQDNIMQGFGNNGGEEFISFLQTGEGLIISRDKNWKNWFENVSGKLLSIQEKNGNWQGHHCITSPVFCTATCLLILSVNNDVKNLLTLSE